MVSAGLVAAALSAHAGLAVPWQWVTAALVGGGSVLAWRSIKKAQPPTAPAQSNHDVNMDIGQTVHVQSWMDDGTCSVKYRGAQWEAALVQGEDATSPGVYTIVEVVGSRLILKKTQLS
jgi:membrane protein implicated in regulation of membrane protease activity